LRRPGRRWDKLLIRIESFGHHLKTRPPLRINQVLHEPLRVRHARLQG